MTLGPPCHDAQVYREPHYGWVYSQPNSRAKLPPFDTTCTRRSDRGNIIKNAITGALLSQTTSVKENRVSGRHEMLMGRSFESGGFLSGYESSISLTQTCMTCGRKRGLYYQATRTRKSNPHSTKAALKRPRPSSWASECLGAVHQSGRVSTAFSPMRPEGRSIPEGNGYRMTGELSRSNEFHNAFLVRSRWLEVLQEKILQGGQNIGRPTTHKFLQGRRDT